MENPAEQLKGLVLDGDWKVLAKAERSENATGGCFSCGYVVESGDGTQGYLKALDYSGALAGPDPALALEAMTQAFNFERTLCDKCRDTGLRRVVSAITDGKVFVDRQNPMSVVQYLIFELADGDIRRHMDTLERFDLAWALRTLHHVATGLRELHMVGIAHQDLKPSNVLVFKRVGSKVADLGRASYKGAVGPCDHLDVAGDRNYAPPELLYKYVMSDWAQRRFGCDAYHLGSLAVFLFARACMTSLLLASLAPEYHWRTWAGSFDEVLPYLRDAFGIAIDVFSQDVHNDIREQMTSIVRELCDPDPRVRGHPHDRAGKGNPYSLERFVSAFNLLASKVEHGLMGR
jgi:serine/threonine protein kinase